MKKGILGVVILLGIFGCFTHRDRVYKEYKFNIGDIVYTKISNQKGQILKRYINWISTTNGAERTCIYRYEVRLSMVNVYTDVGIIREDGPISKEPFTVVCMYEYELMGGE